MIAPRTYRGHSFKPAVFDRLRDDPFVPRVLVQIHTGPSVVATFWHWPDEHCATKAEAENLAMQLAVERIDAE